MVTLFRAAGCKREVTNPKSEAAVLIGDQNLIQSQSIMKKLKVKKLHFSRMMHASSLEVVADLTSAGCGVGILPTQVARSARKRLIRVPGAPIFNDETCHDIWMPRLEYGGFFS